MNQDIKRDSIPAAIMLGLIFGILIGLFGGHLATRSDYRKQAIQHECAQYDINGDFTWIK